MDNRPPPLPHCAVRLPLPILYATVSGNAEELAGLAAAQLAAPGRPAEAINLADYSIDRLRAAPCALFIISTWGDGEPPPDAADFFQALRAGAPDGLAGLRYAVFALGSSLYPAFCASGRELDGLLAAAGAQSFLPRAEADTKYVADFRRWLDQVSAALADSP